MLSTGAVLSARMRAATSASGIAAGSLMRPKKRAGSPCHSRSITTQAMLAGSS
jgi:hypothetical protein